MPIKEKIIKIWLTFVLTFIGFSKVLIIIPFILQIEIRNRYLVNFIDLIFKPADFIGGLIVLSAVFTGPVIFLYMFFTVIARFLLFAAESYILARLILILARNESVKSFFKNLLYTVANRLYKFGQPNEKTDNYESVKNIKYLVLVIIFLVISLGGYLIWNKYLDKIEPQSEKLIDETEATQKKGLSVYDRDNQRVRDILALSEVLENYFNKNNQYPITTVLENIGDENSNSFKMLQSRGYLNSPYNDPLFPSYYYGYKSDGRSYELTAVLEYKKDSRCVTEENLCIFRHTREKRDGCIYPTKISDFALGNFFPNTKLNGNIFRTLISYENPDFEAEIFLTNFVNSDDVKPFIDRVKKRSEQCTIDGIEGFCGIDKIYNAPTRTYLEVNFTWQDLNTFRVVKINGFIQNENLSDKEGEAKEYLSLFVSVFKNCKTENK